jgi:hypothetical protein
MFFFRFERNDAFAFPTNRPPTYAVTCRTRHLVPNHVLGQWVDRHPSHFTQGMNPLPPTFSDLRVAAIEDGDAYLHRTLIVRLYQLVF